MKKLFVVRHAKSSWKIADLNDVDRPLKGRGVRDAYSTAEWLANQGDAPDLIISSPATRALHTALIFAKRLNIPFSEIDIRKEIYEGGLEAQIRLISEIDDRYDSAMIFGHNPTITHLVNYCIEHHIDHVPTTGMAYLKFDISSWKQVNRSAELIFFEYPKKRDKRKD